MAIQRKSRVIDGRTFEVEQLGAMAGIKMLRRLTAALGPALAKLVGDAKGGGAVLDRSVSELAGAVEALVDRLPEAELESLIKALLQGATIDGKPLLAVMELELAGQTLTILQVVAFAIEVNFGDFFAALGARSARAQAMAIPSPSTMSGTSPGK